MKRQRLKHWRTPHGGVWNFPDPRDGQLVQAQRYDLLDTALKKKSVANGWPVGLGWDEWVEDILCTQHPGECAPEGQKLHKRRRRDLSDVLRGTLDMVAESAIGTLARGTLVMAAHKIAGSPLVDQAEADRRASTCATCPRNVIFSKPCSGHCPELDKFILSTIGNRHVKREAELNQCDICGCLLQAAVWFELSVQCKGTTETMRQDFADTPNCWKQCV